ncbi:esterase/lipase family protein [Amycolatopsis anabasis]|uniref:esterase/lipase family protein n=1 Tax=Amycolatopsis anabasis TaxID=1840409 RepID=UPI00131BD375|nr:hypothetical protein [Amycolatopsis anabasis]
MRSRNVRRLCAALVSLLSVAVLLSGNGVAVADDGPPLHTPVDVLDAAVKCDPSATDRKTVVLVPGTFSEATEVWSWNYRRALPAAGFAVCTVRLPGRSVTSIYHAADYMVYAIRKARDLSRQKVSVIGHSQGGSHPLWAMKFWPDVRAAVDDYIGLAPGVNGTQLGNILCAVGACADITWQVGFGSTYLDRLHQGGLPPGVSYTNVWTQLDEIVFPQPAASNIPGGSNVSVQSICPGRIVEHMAIIADSVAYALAMDALTHPGPADPRRIGNRLALCATPFLPRIDLTGLVGFLGGGAAGAVDWLTRPLTTSEPPLPDYAR